MITASGIKKRKITTNGWTFYVEWRDDTTTWVPLSVLKESNPLMLADYVISMGIEKYPAFAWWIPSVTLKRKYIVKQIQHCIPKKSMKFGIIVPGSVNEAINLDKENGNTLWQDSIWKEINNVQVVFKLLEDKESLPVGSK